MARILISGASPIGLEGKFAVFYEGFINALLNCGNEVCAVNSADFLKRFWCGQNKERPYIDTEKLIRDIRRFSPEIIIAFNNSIPQSILDNTDCPVAVWDADAIQFYNDKDYISKHIDRYVFLCFSQAGVQNALDYYGVGKDKVHLVLAGTAVQAEPLKQDKNISFIGTSFRPPKTFETALKSLGGAKLKPVMEGLKTGFYSSRDGDELYKNIHLDKLTVAAVWSAQIRNTVLNNVQELGLTIYGTKNWYDVQDTLPWLAMCYDPQHVYSLKHNQDIYNSSKICINISHSQAGDGFPWRVMDVMASNGCLVSDKKQTLLKFTKNYVDIPMYESPAEAYDLCRRLLADDVWRQEIVAGSQKCIEENGRWENRFKELSSIFGLDIHGESCASSLPDTKIPDIGHITLSRKNYYKPHHKLYLLLLRNRFLQTVKSRLRPIKSRLRRRK